MASKIFMIEWDADDCTVVKPDIDAAMIARMLNHLCNHDHLLGTRPFTVTEDKGYDKGYEAGKSDGLEESPRLRMKPTVIHS